MTAAAAALPAAPRRPRAGRARAAGAALLLALLLAGCGEGEMEARTYAALDRSLREAGRHRTETDPADAPVTEATLARNFVRIALAVETFGRQQAAPQPVRRWERPVVYAVLGGGATAADRAEIGRFMARLSRLTGLDIREGREDINMPIFIVASGERRVAEAANAAVGTPVATFVANFLRAEDRGYPCRGTIGLAEDFSIIFSAVLIKAEVSGALRQACIEEELAQSMGLTNDDPGARPSIFNDDQEFARLTRHDEQLLRMLYSPRLRTGMTEAEVRPLLPAILADLPDGGSS